MRRAFVALAIALVTLGAACDDEPTDPSLSDQYALVRVNGQPLPAVVDSFTSAEGRMRYRRIAARYIVVVAPDSAQYTTVTDVAERATNGELFAVGADCSSVRVGWRRAGSNVLLDFTGFPSPPVPPIDTLRISGRTLLQKLRQGDPADDAYALSYIGDALTVGACFVPE